MATDVDIPLELLKKLRRSETIEEAFLMLKSYDNHIAHKLWNHMAYVIEERCVEYVKRYGDWSMRIGAVLFDRKRKIICKGLVASDLFSKIND